MSSPPFQSLRTLPTDLVIGAWVILYAFVLDPLAQWVRARRLTWDERHDHH